MTDLPDTEAPTDDIDDGDDEAPEPAPRVIVRVSDPEPPTSWTAGPISTRTAKQIGAQVSCGMSYPARRAELAAFTEASADRKPMTDEDVLGGSMPARRRAAPVARVLVRGDADED